MVGIIAVTVRRLIDFKRKLSEKTFQMAQYLFIIRMKLRSFFGL